MTQYTLALAKRQLRCRGGKRLNENLFLWWEKPEKSALNQVPRFDPNLWIDRDTSVLTYFWGVSCLCWDWRWPSGATPIEIRPHLWPWWKILDYFLNFCCLKNQLKPLPSFYFLHRYILLQVSKNELLPKNVDTKKTQKLTPKLKL